MKGEIIVLNQGSTFYRVLTLYSDSGKTTPLSLINKTPRASLMDSRTGGKVADFACAVLDAAAGTIAWTMPRATTAGIAANVQYFADVDLDDVDGVTTDRAATYDIYLQMGQAPV